VHAEVLPWTICLPTLVLIAKAVFVLERGQTNRQTNKQTRLNALPHAGGYAAGVGNKKRLSQKVHCPVQVLQSGKAVLREKEFVKGVGFKTVMEVREISILRVVNRQKKKM